MLLVAWEQVSLAFVVYLPLTKEEHNAILAVVDRLTKCVYFIPTYTSVTASKVTKLFVAYIFKLHRMLHIILHQNAKFTS